MEIAIAIGRRCKSRWISHESTVGILIGGVTKGRCGHDRACDDRWIKRGIDDGDYSREIAIEGCSERHSLGFAIVIGARAFALGFNARGIWGSG